MSLFLFIFVVAPELTISSWNLGGQFCWLLLVSTAQALWTLLFLLRMASLASFVSEIFIVTHTHFVWLLFLSFRLSFWYQSVDSTVYGWQFAGCTDNSRTLPPPPAGSTLLWALLPSTNSSTFSLTFLAHSSSTIDEDGDIGAVCPVLQSTEQHAADHWQIASGDEAVNIVKCSLSPTLSSFAPSLLSRHIATLRWCPGTTVLHTSLLHVAWHTHSLTSLSSLYFSLIAQFNWYSQARSERWIFSESAF